MHRRFIKYIMAALLSLLMVIPTMGSARADTLCDSACILDQLMHSGIPANLDGSATLNADHSMQSYIGANGWEIRYGRDATWGIVTMIGALAVTAVTHATTGTPMTPGDVVKAGVGEGKIRSAAQPYVSTAVSASLVKIAQNMLQQDRCLGVTIPPAGVAIMLARGAAFAQIGVLAGLLPQSPDDIRVWFEPCSNERASGLADTVSPSLGIMSGDLSQATAASAIPVTGGSASTMTSLGRDVLTPGQKMYPNQYLTSLDGRFVLALQNDGNLVAYGPGYVPIWSSGTSGRSVDCLLVQGDGNVVLYGANNSGPIWATNTSTSGGAILKMQEDGNVVVYNSSGVSLWNTGTTRATTGGTYDNSFQLTDGQWLRPGHYLRSGDFRYTLYLQNDGNIVFYSAGKRQWWTSNTGGHPNVEGLLMQSDGNLVLYAQGAIWATNTGGAGPHKLLLQNDGNMVLYGGNGATWSTGTAGKI
ncbi:hypothetical protein ACWCPS_00390 [Streptomyces mauvecolor]